MQNGARENLLTVRCDDAEYEAIKQLAKKRGQSLSDLIRTLVKENEGKADHFEVVKSMLDRANAISKESGERLDESRALIAKAKGEREEAESVWKEQREAVELTLNKADTLLDRVTELLATSKEQEKTR